MRVKETNRRRITARYFIKFITTDDEKSRPEQEPSESKAKNHQSTRPKKTYKEEKPQEDILSRLDYLELPERDISLKFAPCIKGVIQVKLSSN